MSFMLDVQFYLASAQANGVITSGLRVDTILSVMKSLLCIYVTSLLILKPEPSAFHHCHKSCCLISHPLLFTLPCADLATVNVTTPSASYVRVNGSTASTLTFLVAPYGNIQLNAPATALVSATPASATVTHYNN